jgi:hypothetical protein
VLTLDWALKNIDKSWLIGCEPPQPSIPAYQRRGNCLRSQYLPPNPKDIFTRGQRFVPHIETLQLDINCVQRLAAPRSDCLRSYKKVVV